MLKYIKLLRNACFEYSFVCVEALFAYKKREKLEIKREKYKMVKRKKCNENNIKKNDAGKKNI